MAQLQPGQEAYHPRRGALLIPLASLALSVPPLVGILALTGLGLSYGLTGHAIGGATTSLVISPVVFALVVCYLILGPMLAAILCVVQRAQGPLPDLRAQAITRLALVAAGCTVAITVFLICLGFVLRAGT